MISYPLTTFQSVSPFSLTHRRPVLGVFILRLSCDLKRRTPPLGERVHTLPQPGHSTRATPLSSKRWREICTSPENVHLSGAAGDASAFLRDRAREACSVETEGGIFCSSFEEETWEAVVSPSCAGKSISARPVSTPVAAPSIIHSVSRRNTRYSA